MRRIAAAEKPVASEDMTLLMRAGKPVIFEPAIVTELASLGRWDEGPLVNMIRSGGFAFMITTENAPGGSFHRTPAVDAAMREAYPKWSSLAPESVVASSAALKKPETSATRSAIRPITRRPFATVHLSRIRNLKI